MTHELKIDERYMLRRLEGVKPFEIRFNDRDYQVGDTVMFLGSSRQYKITYIHSGLGMADGYVCMTLEQIKEGE